MGCAAVICVVFLAGHSEAVYKVARAGKVCEPMLSAVKAVLASSVAP
jgi:hypothetical protein